MYEIEHIAPLTQTQKDALALAITEIHSTKFTTPRLFVNVKITDASKQETYVAGKPVSTLATHNYFHPMYRESLAIPRVLSPRSTH